MQDWIAGLSAITIFSMTVIQISPLKLDPWTVLGNALNKDLRKEMDGVKVDVNKKLTEVCSDIESVSKRVDKNTAAMEEQQAEDWRTKILRFSDEIMLGQIHSQEHFNQVLDDINRYEAYCRTHPDFINNKAVVSIQRIMAVYKKCLEENSFN